MVYILTTLRFLFFVFLNAPDGLTRTLLFFIPVLIAVELIHAFVTKAMGK